MKHNLWFIMIAIRKRMTYFYEMYGDVEKIDEMKESLNSVSPSFCLAKWMHCTVHLMTGHTHSCYLPQTHKIPLSEIEKDPSALHNTEYKKSVRKMMKEGERPKECSICWSIEDLSDERYSDRHYRGVDDWTMPFFDKIKKMEISENVNPTYLEVSWSAACNFKCMYCSPAVSTSWLQEVKSDGPYQLSEHKHQDLSWFKDNGLFPLDEEDNPYIEAFWKWWPELVSSLMYFRITGGEPLLSQQTFKTLDWLNEHPHEKLELSINSNLGVNEKQFNRFMISLSSLVKERKIKRHILHTSIDTWGKHAEYIRNGLKLEQFQKYVDIYLKGLPTAGMSIMCTFNILSVCGFKNFLDWVLSLRKAYNNFDRQVFLDIPHLQGPEMFSARILTDDFHPIMEENIKYMKERIDDSFGFKVGEIQKMERILSWMKEPLSDNELRKYRKDFYLFIKEHDRRRGTNFLETFPEMKKFWSFCESLFE